jgi:hypothetical protein
MADTATETEAKPEKATKAPLPEGFITPVNFAKALGAKLGKEIRPQIIYGYIKNNGPESKNPFPFEKNSDGAFIVNEQAAYAWYDALQERKANREQKKAADEAAKAAKAAAAAETPAAEEPAAKGSKNKS